MTRQSVTAESSLIARSLSRITLPRQSPRGRFTRFQREHRPPCCRIKYSGSPRCTTVTSAEISGEKVRDERCCIRPSPGMARICGWDRRRNAHLQDAAAVTSGLGTRYLPVFSNGPAKEVPLTLFSPRISAGMPKSNVPKTGSTSKFRPFTCHIQLLISR